MAVRHGYGKVAGTDALVFAYDTGDTVNSYKGEPTTNLLGTTGDMAPPNPDTPYDLTTSSNSVTDVNGTTWDFSRYSNTNLAADGGIAWDPYIKGPGFTGAWRLKKRPGGNWETQFQNGLGAVTNDTDIVLTVWCKASVAGVARINTNTTRAGSSYWGYSSAYHSGNGTWERLYVVIPGGSEVTSINVIRCQIGGTTVNTDVYFRHFQVEYNTHATQFTTGTRSVSGSLLDLTGNSSITAASNQGYDSNAQIVYDGTDDKIITQNPQFFNNNSGDTSFSNGASYEFVVKAYGTGYFAGVGSAWRISAQSTSFIFWDRDINSGGTDTRSGIGSLPVTNNYVHVVGVLDPINGEKRFYINGVEELNVTYTRTPSMGTTQLALGKSYPNSNDYCNCELPVGKVYTKALTAAEVQSNYRHYKNRFGI